MKTSRLLALAVAAPFVLSGCESIQSVVTKKQPPPCPPVYILSDASHVTRFRPGPGRDLTDVELEAEIIGFKGACGYDERGAEVELQVAFEVKRGPAATGRKAELTYFIAIPKYFPAPEAKAEFTLPVEFPEGMNQARATDESVVLRIPVKDRDIITNYEIYLGLQASAEELEMNRRSKR